MPYLRYEEFNRDAGDPYFSALRAEDYDLWIAGVRYNLAVDSAVKAEARWVDRVGFDRFMEYAFQWAFAF